MRKLIMWNLVSLDGFFEGPDRDVGWFNDYWGDELAQLSIDQLESADALLFGRVTYEMMASYWPTAQGEIADYMNRLPKFVASRTLEEAEWNNTRLIREDAPEEIARFKGEPGKDIYLFGSAELAASLIPYGLIDEYRIGLCPLLLGNGKPLFEASQERLQLELLETRKFATGAIFLRYQPT